LAGHFAVDRKTPIQSEKVTMINVKLKKNDKKNYNLQLMEKQLQNTDG